MPEAYKHQFNPCVFDGVSMIDREKARARALKHYYKYQERYQAYARKYNAEHKEERKRYRQEHREHLVEKARERRHEIRRQVLAHYSDGVLKCAHCGIADERALTIDHVNGGGCKHRRMLGMEHSSDKFYLWLIRNDFPEGYQVLCYNCNCVKGHYGVYQKQEVMSRV